MIRVEAKPRADWRKIVEPQGLTFHTMDDVPYWNESAYYLFESAEIDAIEVATQRLDAMCLEAVEHVISEGRLGDFDIPEPFHKYVTRSWEFDEHTIYGRFDLSYDGKSPPKLLEYNADTPTSLLEAAVIQWFWMKDMTAAIPSVDRPQFDQFNSIHERLIEAWGRIKKERGPRVVFAVMEDSPEDFMTVTYLRDTAVQAGLQTDCFAMNQIGWHAQRRVFTDLREQPIPLIFKLYPWEWMVREQYGRNLLIAPTRWLEPPWKMILSNKAILPILWELFPGSPYLLRSEFEPFSTTYVVKPAYSREGANVTVVVDGQVVAETDGEYSDGLHIYQDYHPLPDFHGRRPVVGSWMVNGNACGIGIREDDGPITRNTSQFLPHLYRKAPWVKPPAFSAVSESPRDPGADPLWDRWLDR